MAQAHVPIAAPADDGGHQGMHSTPDQELAMVKPEDRSYVSMNATEVRADPGLLFTVLLLIFGTIGVIAFMTVLM